MRRLTLSLFLLALVVSGAAFAPPLKKFSAPAFLKRTYIRPACAGWLALEGILKTRGTYVFEGMVNVIREDGSGWANLYKKKGRNLPFQYEMFWAIPAGVMRAKRLELNSRFFVVSAEERNIYVVPDRLDQIGFFTSFVQILKAKPYVLTRLEQARFDRQAEQLAALLASDQTAP